MASLNQLLCGIEEIITNVEDSTLHSLPSSDVVPLPSESVNTTQASTLAALSEGNSTSIIETNEIDGNINLDITTTTELQTNETAASSDEKLATLTPIASTCGNTIDASVNDSTIIDLPINSTFLISNTVDTSFTKENIIEYSIPPITPITASEYNDVVIMQEITDTEKQEIVTSPKKRKLDTCDPVSKRQAIDGTESIYEVINSPEKTGIIENLNKKIDELSKEVQILQKQKQIETEIFQTQIAILRESSNQQSKPDNVSAEICKENCSILDCVAELSKLNNTIILYLNQFHFKNKLYQSSFATHF